MKESVVENLKRKYKGMTACTLRTAKLITIMTVFMSAILFSPEEAYAKTTKTGWLELNSHLNITQEE